MELESKLRALQDSRRNAGWRIQWIPWQADDKPEYVHNTRATGVLGLLGAAAFMVGVALLLLGRQQAIGLAIAAASPVLIIASRLWAAWSLRRNWVAVEATCLDSEVLKGYAPRQPGLREVWELRLQCRFELGGRAYTVTPEIAGLTSFASNEAATDYLRRHLGAGRTCRLWVDPANPLHASFHRRPRI